MNRQGRWRGLVKSEWSIDQGSYLTEAYLRDRDRSKTGVNVSDQSDRIRPGAGHGHNNRLSNTT